MDKDEKMIQAQQMPVLTIESNGSYVTAADAKEQAWYELQNAYRSRRILSGVLGGIEESGESTVAVVYYKDFRVVIPVDEMMLNLTENAGYGEMKSRQIRILNHMLGCEVDFIILGIDAAAQSVVASRKQAMLVKRNKVTFLSVRSITDTADHKGIENFDQNCEAASLRSARAVMGILEQLSC